MKRKLPENILITGASSGISIAAFRSSIIAKTSTPPPLPLNTRLPSMPT